MGNPMFVVTHLLGMALVIASFLLPRMYIVNNNQAQDRVIEQACKELATKTGTVTQYRTLYTGVCKPKGALPFRAIAVGPGGTFMPITPPNTVMVQVPAGSGPGTKLQVQSPSGQQVEVVVPQGVSAGQCFQAALATEP